MKGLILFALIISPAVYAGMSCTQLGEYISRNQGEILTAKAPGVQCTDTNSDTNTIEYFKCRSVANIDEKIANVEHDVTLLMGFQQMKNEIRDNKEETASENLTKARRAARDFKAALSTARALQLILNTDSTVPLIQDLQNVPVEQRNDPGKLGATIQRLCASRAGLKLPQNNPGACSGLIIDDKDPEVVTNINTLIANGVTPERIEEWKNTLQIQVEGKPGYTFATMYDEIGGAMEKVRKGELGVTRSELNAINSLPDFKDKNSLPFLDALKGKTQQMKVHTAIDGYRNLSEEIKNRQLTQTMAKVSWLVKEAGTSQLSADQKAACDSILKDISKTKDCWEAMKSTRDALNGSRGAGLITSMEQMIDGSFGFLDEINGLSTCLTNENLEKANTGYQFDTGCERFNVSDELLQAKINFAKDLKVLKGQILQAQQRKVTLTALALEKYRDCQGVTGIADNIVCPAGAPVSPSVEALVSDLQGMAFVRSENSDEDAVKQQCEEATGVDETFCETYVNVKKPVTPDSPNKPLPSSSSPYVDVQNPRDPSRDAVNDGLSMIGWGVVNQLRNPPMMYNPYLNYNPFPYYNNPYAGMGGLSPADQILFSARYYGGYGVYTPTYGLTPYNAFPLISPYVQAGFSSSANTSSYFTNFGTYK
ncbi:MAG: hypothetical protein ACJ76H_13530 [Bacteriovoracaceae bacterium]